MSLLFFFYTLLLESIYFLLSPILFALFRKIPYSERLAINYPKKKYNILIHAASVGEINGIKQLLFELLETKPHLSILLTTNTRTGRKTAQSLNPGLDVVISPLDVLHLRLKQLALSKPDLILIVETEIWPSLFFAAKLKKIPIILINARVSAGTFKTYQSLSSILSYTGSTIKAICAQSEADKERFEQIFKTKVIRAGNLKFSIKQPEFDRAELRKQWGYAESDFVIVFGSSRPGEEALILQSFDMLKATYNQLKLIIAPRHSDRMDEINQLLKDRAVSYYSESKPAQDIHIIDEMGNLLPAYALGDIAIIGGSFYPFGGHNPLEAAYYSRIIIMGPNYTSCQGSVKRLRKANAIIISNPEKITSDIRNIIKSYDKYKPYGDRAKQVLQDNSESLPIHLDIINKYLPE